MRLTDFWGRMERVFGPTYARSVARDRVFSALGGRTVDESIASGDDVKAVWRAVCAEVDVPADER